MPVHRKHAKARYWVGYCRKSTDTEDKQIHTLQDQHLMVEEHYARLPDAEKAGRPLKLFQEAQSAYRPGRPVFNTILQMADRGAVHGLIVVHPNRLSRNHADSGSFVQRLVERRIDCLDTTTGKRYTGADSNDIFMLTLEGAMSWKDSRDKGDRVRQAMRLRAAEGRHMGPVRIGYRSVYRPDGTPALEVVAEAAGPVRRLFDLAATGTYSVGALAAEADRIGLRSRGGKRLGRSAVHALLHDPLYKGLIRFDGILAKGVHEPIVDEALWARVQAQFVARHTQAGKPKDLALRELFVFGTLLRCPKWRYIYYQCKNPDVRCGVIVPQPTLVEQLQVLLGRLCLYGGELDQFRESLLHEHRDRRRDNGAERRGLNAAYEKVLREIGDLFAQRKEAETLGILDAVDLRLDGLRQRRDELQTRLAATHDGDGDCIEAALGAFKLIELLREAILAGPMRTREMGLKALASNYTVEGGKLLPELRAPFRQHVEKGGRPGWLPALYDVKTEVMETFRLLKETYAGLGE
jgi:site-specific DNA recombinase